MPVEIREAREEDLEQLTVLFNQQSLYHLPFDSFYKYDDAVKSKFRSSITDAIQNRETERFLVATDGEKIVGYCAANIRDARVFEVPSRRVWITNTFIEEDYRGKGLFDKLFNGVKEWAQEKGINTIQLGVHHKNENAKKAYYKLGATHYINIMRFDLE